MLKTAGSASEKRSKRSRSVAVAAICVGMLMISVDTTIVTVAMPSIAADFGISGTSLSWLLNSYLLGFGGTLIVGGRMGDLFGHRRILLVGIGLFTVASFMCGVSQAIWALAIARGFQGIGGAIVSAVSLSLVSDLSTNLHDRARAVGIYGLLCTAGGGIGNVFGGLLTEAVGWHWIFLINIPIGIAVYACCARQLLPDDTLPHAGRLDLSGALAVTVAATLILWALVSSTDDAWSSLYISLSFIAGVSALTVFILIERRAANPLVPQELLSNRNLTVSSMVGVLWSASALSWFVVAALYLQGVRNYNPLQVGLAFLPATVMTAVISAGPVVLLVTRLGARTTLIIGLLLVAGGLAVFSMMPLAGSFVTHILPGMLLFGMGGGIASTPLLITGLKDVAPRQSGLASGLLNTSFTLGGALGVGMLVSMAEVRARHVLGAGEQMIVALSVGYRLAFLCAAILALSAAVVALLTSVPLGRPVSGDLSELDKYT